MPESDWTQFIPDLIVGLIVGLLVGGVIAYLRSDRFKQWFSRLLNTIMRALKWLTAKWHFIILHFLVVVLAVVFRIYADWRILVFSLVCYVVGMLSWRLSIGRPISFGGSKSIKSKYLPISVSGIGNSYLKSRYVAPPSGDTFVGKAQFRLEPDALIFDTNEQIRYHTPRNDGGKEIDLQLPKPQNQIKSAYFLINSENSKSIYAHQGIGEIKLVFKDAPPIIVELVLGENIREWCPGNPGDFVREASSPMLTMGAWAGLSKNGANAVIDCLQIPVYECMRNCFLKRIILVHKSLRQPSDAMGAHFSVFAVSLEIAQGV
jgi:hypothetical protein